MGQSGVEGVEDAALEVGARAGGDDGLAGFRGKRAVADAEDVELDDGCDERHFGGRVVRDFRGGVQGDALPGQAGAVGGDAAGGQEGVGLVGAVEVEALLGGAELLGETEVVEEGPHVEQLRVEVQACRRVAPGVRGRGAHRCGQRIAPPRAVDAAVVGPGRGDRRTWARHGQGARRSWAA
ncbi:hypothetical protein AB0D83_05195 [Streptomyces decoyicus]|uniref:hypothetical protein n=1 Tax=Streptomyces decoyicus TaxID=249567 RepID=UPI0033F05E2E